MKRFYTLLALLCSASILSAQVGISTAPATPDPSAMLDIKSQDRGLLVPRMTEAQRDAISAPAHALLIYQTDGVPGFYYNEGTPGSPLWAMMSASGVHLEDRTPIDSLPYAITAPGSYYVTASLSGGAGIQISTSNVVLDLNGYNVSGTGGNLSSGIEVTGAFTGIAVRNGVVNGWGHEGIKASSCSDCHFSQLQIYSSGFDGLLAGEGSVISQVSASSNGFDGIDAGNGSTVTFCTAQGNTYDGIEADKGSIISESASYQNGGSGYKTNGACTVIGNSGSGNTGHGFSCGAGTTAKNNSAAENNLSGMYLFSGCHAENNTARDNARYGIECLDACMIRSNTAVLNDLSGFYTSFSGARFDGNTSNLNAKHGFHIQNSGGCLLTRNSTQGNTLAAYSVLPGNTLATILTSANINTNNNPYANFEY